MKARGATLCILAVAIAAAIGIHAQTPPPPAPPQQSQPVFRSSVDLVTIDVTVTTSGIPISGLHAADFLLTDNGVPQSLEVVALEAVPATVTMIIDVGDFMRETIKSFVDDVRKIAALVRPGDDVRLMAIDTYVRDLVPLRKSAQWPQIDRFTTNGLASANDAIAAAIMRQYDPNRQHLIIAMTNGVDTGSALDINTLMEIARRSNAPLHIVPADLVLENVGPPKSYSTRQERGGGLGMSKRRLWMPFHDRDFELLEQAAQLTGGSWQLPGLFFNRGASMIFENLYRIHRRSYRLTYVPKGVTREGWHAVSVTVPRFPSYEIGARPGYAVEARRPAAAAAAPVVTPAVPLVEGLVAAYDSDSPGAFTTALAGVTDHSALIEAFDQSGNPWPDKPKREAAFVLELSLAALASGERGVALSVRDLLNKHRLLVRDPLGPDSFEKLWLWTAVAIFESVNAQAVSENFVTSALARFPDEPRLLLAKAFLLDRQQPFAWGPASRNDLFIPQFSGGQLNEVRISTPSGLSNDHVRDVSAAYDAAMVSADTAAEARIRKSLLLFRAGRPQEALALLESAGARTQDLALRYFSNLFRGRVQTALGSAGDAAAAYEAALALAPLAQSPRVALMALALYRGDREAAAAMAEQIQKAGPDAWDPWWNYWQGDYRLVTGALSRMRTQTR